MAELISHKVNVVALSEKNKLKIKIKTESMEKKDFEKEPYEVPKIAYFEASVEMGFAGSSFTPGQGEEEDWEW